MSQIIFTAKEAKNNFGRLLDEARRSPVVVTKNGREVVVILCPEDYSHFNKFRKKFKRFLIKK